MQTILLAAVLCIGTVTANSAGAPITACASMSPNHAGGLPQPLPSPYVVTLSESKVQPRANVIVTIVAPAGDFFRGFLVQARDASDLPVGTFEASADAKVMDCSLGTQNSISHKDKTDKTKTSLVWVAPSLPVNVTFTVTTVRVMAEFWVGQTVPLTVAP